MKTPIYFEFENKALSEQLNEINELIYEIERKSAFLSIKKPMLCAIPAPNDDCISIGNIVVYGVSTLNEEQKDALTSLLKGF